VNVSKGEERFAAQLDAAGIGYERELMLIPGRRFRFDFLITGTDLIVEVEGGTWSGGRHTRPAGFKKDCEKYNLALQHGYRVLRYTTDMVNKGDAATQVGEILGNEGVKTAL
jgi:very-short-patch-repair endonuclease